MSKIRLNPIVDYISYKKDEPTVKTVEVVDAWYVYDAFDTNEEEHREQPGVSVSFSIGKKDVSITIPWRNLVLAMGDIIEAHDEYREERKSWDLPE